MLKWFSIVFRSLVGLLAVVAAVAVTALLVATKPHPPKKSTMEAPPVVRAVVAQRIDLPVVWTGYGTARPLDAADVSAEVAGRIVERPAAIEAGSAVRAGDVLARIDATTYAARVESLERQIDQAVAELDALEVEEASVRQRVALSEEQAAASQRDLDRARQAESLGAGNESQIDARIQALQRDLVALEALREQLARVPSRREALRAQIAARTAERAAARHDLERTTIVSPITGVIQRVEVEAGEYVAPGAPVARVVDLSRIEIPVRLPVSAAGLVVPGDRAELRADDAAGTVWSGAVTRIAPEADAQTRTFTVFVVVEQSPEGRAVLQPGRFVAATVISARTASRLVVPRRVVDVDRVRVAEPVAVDEAAAESRSNPRLARIDFSRAVRLMRVREVEVNVERYIEGSAPGIDADETQWAVLDEGGVAPGRALREGHHVLVGALEQVRVGSVVDVRTPGEASGEASGEAGASRAAEGGAS